LTPALSARQFVTTAAMFFTPCGTVDAALPDNLLATNSDA